MPSLSLPQTAAEPISAAGVAVIIPTLNEAQSIAGVIGEIPSGLVREIIIADGGSSDGTQAAARAAGARVVDVKTGGYGRACMAGLAAAPADCGIIVFMDGDGADRADLMAQLVEPVRRGEYDLVLASRGARTGGDELASAARRPPRRARDQSALRRSLHRYVRLSRDPSRLSRTPRHARIDLWLEP